MTTTDAPPRPDGDGDPSDGGRAEALVVPLDGSGVPEAVAGGKAAALDRLVAWGFPVPPSAVVTAAAYRRFVTGNDLGPALARVVRQERWEPLDVARLFTTAPMPDDVAAEVLAAARLLGEGPFAVRSSATAEDTGDASFAGQYHSEIGVGGAELLTAVKRVWASLWAPAAAAYRRRQGVGEADLAMAVVVMPVVPAELAGVAFTVDPGGAPDHLRVELVRGLAEGLVSGRETPDVLVVPRHPPRHLPEAVAPVVDELADLALAVEEAAGRPQDLEWVAVDGRVQLVQARPVTTRPPDAPADDDGFDTPALPGATYTSAGIAEVLPGTLPPLVWTVAGPLLEEGFRQLLDDLGVLPADLTGAHGVVGRFRARAALNLDLLRSTAQRVPGGSAAEVERQYFGEVVSGDTPRDGGGGAGGPVEGDGGQGRLGGVAALRRALRLRRRATADAAVVVGAVDLVASAGVDPADLDDPALLAHLARLEHLAGQVAATQVRVAAAAAAAYRGLEVLLARHLGEDGAGAAAQRLTAGAGRSSAGRASLPTDELARLVRDRGLAGVAADHEGVAPALAALAAAPGGDEVVARWHDELARSGSMAVFAGPTWAEDPDGAWQAVRHLATTGGGGPSSAHGDGSGEADNDSGGGDGGDSRAGPPSALAEVEAELTGTWRWRLVRVVTGQVVDVRRRLLRRLAADATEMLARREATKGALLRLGGEVRRAHLEAGARLAARGALRAAADVDLLGRHELAGLAGGPLPGRAELAGRRRALAEAEAAGPLPRRFDGRPGPVAAGGDGEGVLRGWGASAGTHTGPVRVVADPRRAGVHPGDVLVATTTDPSWTPLFLRAGALVVEEGGPLSHAAILARELGLPAVLNVPGAVAALADGAEVAVDGGAGTVEVVG